MPSFKESFGYIFLEAMASGNAILASKTSGAHHCLAGGEIAPLFDADDLDGFSQEICKLAQDHQRLLALKQRCFARANAPIFSREFALEKWMKLLQI